MTKIMLVEDDKSLREIYGVRLLAEGYEIISAGDGEEALAMAVKEHPDLIISDVMMPKISGFDMLDILRSTPETKQIKIIMMTALSSEDQRSRGESLGANRYLVKSQVGIEDVVRTVHEVLEDIPLSATPASQSFGAPAPSSISEQSSTTIMPEPTAETAPPKIQSQPTDAPVPETGTKPEFAFRSTTEPSVEPTAVTEPIAEAVQEPEVSESINSSIPPLPNPLPTPTTNDQSTFSTETPLATPQLPEPMAPFSTPAPASLGAEIIGLNTSATSQNTITPQPINNDFSRKMANELGETQINPPESINPPAQT